jgi:hypothetical protein
MKVISAFILGLMLAASTVAFAAPTETYQKSLYPLADSLYELGSSTRAWLKVTTDELCLAGDCETAWPSGGGSSLSDGILNAMTYWTGTSTLAATTSPTVGYLTATSTATSTFAGGLQASGTGFRVGSAVTANSFYLTNAGELGLGTTLPLGKLYVAGTYTTANAYGVRYAPTLASSLTGTQYQFASDGSFNPTGASLSAAYGVYSNPNISGSALTITTFGANAAILQSSAGFTGNVSNGYTYRAQAPSLLGANPVMGTFTAFYADATTNGNGTTTGIINNYQARLRGNTAAAGFGGTINNYGMSIDVPLGTGQGVTTNYGIRISGDGGTVTDAASTTNYALYVDSQAPTYFESKVGIGSTTPRSQLTVSSSVGATTTLAHSGTALVNGRNIGFMDFFSGEANVGRAGVYAAIGARAIDPTGGVASINSSANEGGGLFFNTCVDTVGSTDLTCSERLTIDQFGNVGIGTTSPYAKLSLHAKNGDTNPNLFAIGSSTASGTTTLFEINNQGQVAIKGATALAVTTAIQAKGNILVDVNEQLGSATDGRFRWTPSTGTFNTVTNHVWQVNSVEKVRLTATGLGLGSSTPSRMLVASSTEVTGGTPIFALDTSAKASASGGPIIDIFHGGQHVAFIKGASGTGNTSPFLSFGTGLNSAAPTEVGRFDENGNFGVGSTSPFARLSITGASGGTVAAFVTDTGTKLLEMLNTGVTALLGTWDFSNATVKQHVYRSFSWPAGPSMATTTTATTTIWLGPRIITETWGAARCSSNAVKSVGFRVTDGTNHMDYGLSTTTAATTTLSTNNVLTGGVDTAYVEVGPMTNGNISCSFDAVTN